MAITCEHIGSCTHTVRMTEDGDTVRLDLRIFPVEPKLPSITEGAAMTGAEWEEFIFAQVEVIDTVRISLADAYQFHSGQRFHSNELTGAVIEMANRHFGVKAHVEFLGRGWKVGL